MSTVLGFEPELMHTFLAFGIIFFNLLVVGYIRISLVQFVIGSFAIILGTLFTEMLFFPLVNLLVVFIGIVQLIDAILGLQGGGLK